MKLLAVELRRFLTRRSNIVITLLGMLFLAGSLAIVAVNSHAPSQAEIDHARAEAQDERDSMRAAQKECEQWWEDNPDGVDPGDKPEDDPDAWEYGSMSGPDDCAEIYAPTTIDDSDYLYQVITFETEAENQLILLATILIIAGLLMASSFVGAEWTSGGMTNLLLWQPRRLRVWTAKAAAPLIWTMALTAVLAVLHIGGLWLIGRFRGQLGTLDARWWTDFADSGLRWFAVVVLAVLCGMALSMIGRRTITAIGIVLGYLVFFEFGLRSMMAAVSVDFGRYVLSTYLIAWIEDGFRLYEISTAASQPIDGSAAMAPDPYSYISGLTGGAVLLGFTVLLMAISMWSFTRRDTT